MRPRAKEWKCAQKTDAKLVKNNYLINTNFLKNNGKKIFEKITVKKYLKK